MTKKLFFACLIILFAVLANLTVGRSDIFTGILIFVVAALMKPVVLEFQMGGRQLMANQFNEDSDVKEVVRKPGFFSHILSFIAAVMISFGLIVLIKGIVMSHGLFSFLALLFVITLALFPILGKSANSKAEPEGEEATEKTTADTPASKKAVSEKVTIDSAVAKKSQDKAVDKPVDDKDGEDDEAKDASPGQRLAERHLVPTASKYAAFVASLVVGIIALNILMAFILSAKDTFIFLASEVTFDNFDEVALEAAIPYNERNTLSRAVINAYVLGDAFRLALTDSVFSVFVPSGNKERFFYLFYILVLFMNLIKLVPFSVGIVVFLRGVRRYSDTVQKWAEERYKEMEPHLMEAWSKARALASKGYEDVKSKVNKADSAAQTPPSKEEAPNEK